MSIFICCRTRRSPIQFSKIFNYRTGLHALQLSEIELFRLDKPTQSDWPLLFFSSVFMSSSLQKPYEIHSKTGVHYLLTNQLKYLKSEQLAPPRHGKDLSKEAYLNGFPPLPSEFLPARTTDLNLRGSAKRSSPELRAKRSRSDSAPRRGGRPWRLKASRD